MKRRQAIQNIALITSGMAFLPACNFEKIPVYSNVPLEGNQYKLIELLTQVILPHGDLEVTTPETTIDFLMTMLNDCYAPEDIQRYLTGLQAFQQKLKEHGPAFKKLEPAAQVELLEQLAGEETASEDLAYFLNTTKRLTVRHFTSSEFFMKNYLNFEFAPGRYLGCVETSS